MLYITNENNQLKDSKRNTKICKHFTDLSKRVASIFARVWYWSLQSGCLLPEQNDCRGKLQFVTRYEETNYICYSKVNTNFSSSGYCFSDLSHVDNFI